jgi:cytochrome c553
MTRARFLVTLAIAAASATGAAVALADGLRGLPAGAPPAYVRECGDCHVAYPPGLLPAASWARLMAGLDRHYGSDASLEPPVAQEIARWLQANAGTCKRVREAPPEDRITRSAWFERKHRRIDPAVWALPSVVGASNCAACHAGAARGVYDDDDLRVPAGTTPRQRRAWDDD